MLLWVNKVLKLSRFEVRYRKVREGEGFTVLVTQLCGCHFD